MTVFGNYARYYDLLYRDKDYAGEVCFINRLIQIHAPDAKKILELGCGTGVHAALLANEGYEVDGVDFSREMLEAANRRRSDLTTEAAKRLRFSFGDVRQIRLDEKFDVVLSLFHVVSYLSTGADLSAAFETARTHLKPGGIFIFDFWYAPAVLHERPTAKVKRMADETMQITRTAEPTIYPNENLVDVNYEIFIENKISGATEKLKETHRMRYLFDSELDFLLENAQLETIASREWMTDKSIGFDTWSVYRIVSCQF